MDARLRFERHFAEVATRFLDLTPQDLDAELGRATEGLLDALDIDRCGLALFSEDTEGLPVRFHFARPGEPRWPPGDLAPLQPWYAQQVRAGRTLVLPNLPDDLPDEAVAEREHVVRTGMRSHVSVPLRTDNAIHGVLTLARSRPGRPWDPALVGRLELLASVFVSAIDRCASEARVKEAEQLSLSVLASLPQEMVVVDDAGRVLARNETWSRESRAAPAPSPGSDDTGAVPAGAGIHGCPLAEDSPALRAVLSGASPRHEGLCRHGARAHAVSITPLQGVQRGAVIVHTDVTELEDARTTLIMTVREVQALKDRLEAENLALQEQVRHTQGFAEVVGTSAALSRVLAQVEQVARTDAPVLLTGETGTGKDAIARALHARSGRADRLLVTVNCAALPATLVESELFGYERGAFTGAVQRTLGRFEVAHGGTLFLDEIGELPMDVQAKLLRVLQVGEFERLGASRTLKADVRVIAATNRDLEREVREGRFRADLFYRLGVFPIAVPPLRARREDIPLLVWHFIGRRQTSLGRTIKSVPTAVMRALTAHDWPGNVRELENVIERALILSDGPTLAADPAFLDRGPGRVHAGGGSRLADAERAHILAVLGECAWRVAGHGNAAERLGLKRSTLQFRMKKLGITRSTGDTPDVG